MMFYIYLIVTIIFSALGQVFYKNYFRENKIVYLILSVLLFVSTPYLSYKALKGISFDIVCISSAFILVLVQLFSRIMLQEVQNKRELTGTAAIILGLLVYAI